MRLKLEIETENQAMVDNPIAETARILRKLADHMEASQVDRLEEFPVRDLNGNTIGSLDYDTRTRE